jgi:hypothetical protein
MCGVLSLEVKYDPASRLECTATLINSVYKINQSFKYFDTQSLFHYILGMKDRNILKLSSKYCYDILRTFDILNELA